jgi:thymidylate kinase
MTETLIAIEGLDGSGKTTQVAMLAAALHAAEVVSFPRYEWFIGQRIRELLDSTGEVSAQTLDPQSMALWYATDRAQWARDRKPVDGIVLLNRYTLSNAVYQSARSAEPDLFDWVLQLEFKELGLPQPDVTVVLDIPTDVSQARVAHRDGAAGDVYERATDLLARVRDGYLSAASRLPNVVVVPAVGPPESVHAAVLAALTPFIP